LIELQISRIYAIRFFSNAIYYSSIGLKLALRLAKKAKCKYMKARNEVKGEPRADLEKSRINRRAGFAPFPRPFQLTVNNY